MKCYLEKNLVVEVVGHVDGLLQRGVDGHVVYPRVQHLCKNVVRTTQITTNTRTHEHTRHRPSMHAVTVRRLPRARFEKQQYILMGDGAETKKQKTRMIREGTTVAASVQRPKHAAVLPPVVSQESLETAGGR